MQCNRLVTWDLGLGISPLNFAWDHWDRDQKHEIGNHSVGIGDQVYHLGILGSFTGSGIKISLKSGLRDQNYLKIAGSSQGVSV